MKDLSVNKVVDLPDSAYYLADFITAEEESNLLEKVYSSPKPRWKTLSNRRLQNWGGLPHAKGMIQEDLPEWLQSCIRKLSDLEIYEDITPNHVLVNEYLPGQGIMPHEDGPLFYPIIATINLGSHTVLDYYKKALTTQLNEAVPQSIQQPMEDSAIGSLLLERRSLLIVKDDLYTKYLHGIREIKEDCLDKTITNQNVCSAYSTPTLIRGTRISLTIRNVPHTLKAKFIFGR